MLDTPQIIQTNAQTAAVIQLKIPRADMMKSFGPAAGELMAALKAQGIKPEGALFAHHLTMSADIFDFELGVRVSTPVVADGRVRPGELPAATAARAVYGGPYKGLPAAWSAFSQWIAANGHEPREDLWEIYVLGPQAASDPAQWRTELVRPLKG